ncbi:TPA: hypothetical protein U2N26_003029 [Acinetobacter nosocomialis]|uniref:hypothetical protein n=1 Tax=Acinetobacter TaxID=469 RepID=UPI00046E1173|nr:MULTISPECIES: hypothetical protein [Acinetobacter]CAH1091219.1 Uncharacterised protein [Acinetobacter phage MD-2021a]MCU4575311.1 hypothetical protein [Acinetobacter nosocomialis]MCU4593524.1 hypothetical protein [Acinetobacter nosocomialis]MDU5771842.1 hypothetical protein [Acinetobacter sp.]MDU5862313.1 hypothetical protein [Acinetobacter sp.]
MSREKQDDWKRTQVRIPQELYDDLTNYAVNKNISLNTAMITLMNKGLETKKHFDSVEESTTIADDMIEKIADKVVERLKEQK